LAILTISAQPGIRSDDLARDVAGQLQFDLVTQSRLDSLYQSEFAGADAIPARGYADIVISMMARLATEHHLVFAGAGAQYLFRHFPDVFRVLLAAPPPMRAGAVMVERSLERPAAALALRELEREHSAWLRARFGRSATKPAAFDLTCNAERWDPATLAATIVAAARACGLDRAPLLPTTAERQIQFEVRLRLARLGVPPPGAVSLPTRSFAHPSEEIFANLLDFYRIAWEYEPRSFPIEWDEQGNVVESFTPDFYLPEMDLYIELTTMKQSLVTKKNRKIKRLRELYPEVNVQVFYQKDFENLIFKYGLEKTAEMIG
jgi:cytidylate kinase-like protein